MKLFFLRHASTDWNMESRYQGQSDIPLNTFGRAEAKHWILPILKPDLVISSPLSRAYETAKILFPNIEVSVDDRLKEMSLGDWEGKTREQVRLEYGELPNGGWYGLDFRVHGGETLREVMDRLQSWLSDLSKKNAENIFIVSHKATISALYALAIDWDYTYKPNPRIRFPNLHIFEFHNRKISPLKINISLKGSE